MSIVFRVLENLNKEGILTIKIEDDICWFNHSMIHTKDEFEEFGVNDFGIVNLNGIEVYHINGHIITNKEYKFILKVFEDEL